MLLVEVERLEQGVFKIWLCFSLNLNMLGQSKGLNLLTLANGLEDWKPAASWNERHKVIDLLVAKIVIGGKVLILFP